jgi:antitoxin component YwqK of YwqJK toxin-antitoxin module
MQKNSLRIAFLMGLTFSATLFAQPNKKVKSPSNQSNENTIQVPTGTLIPKEVKVKRIRWEKFTFDANGVAFYEGQPYSGPFYQIFEPSKDASQKFITSKEGFMVNGLKDGEYKEYSKKGIRQVKETYQNGLKNGPFEYYFEDNGALEFTGEFLKGELHNEVVCYYKSGQKKFVNHYNNGNRNGSCIAYFENGQIESEATFVNEIPDGDEIGYFEDGFVRHIKTFNMGILNGRNYVFHKNNCPAIEEYYKNGKLDSVQRIFDVKTCNIISSGFYKEGVKHGTFVTYDMFEHFGDTIEMKTYDNGQRNGFSVVFKDKFDDKLQRKVLLPDTYGNYINESPDGLWFYGMVSNFQKRHGAYDMGIKIGEWLYYDIEGKLLLKQWYDQDGVKTKEKFFKK